MSAPKSLAESLQRFGMEDVGRYYGPYKGIVRRVDDPEERGRIQAYVARTMGDTELDEWIDAMSFSSGSDRGSFWPPEVGDVVWVYFDNGATHRPTGYVGGWRSSPGKLGALPSEFAYKSQTSANGQRQVIGPERRGFITRQGHQLIFDDTAGAESLRLAWHQPEAADKSKTDRSVTANRAKGKTSSVLFKSDGSIEVTNANGAQILLDAAGKQVVVKDDNSNVITLDKDGVRIESAGDMTLKGKKLTCDFQEIQLGKGADSALLKAAEFAQTFGTHTHGSPAGPTTPPIAGLVPPSNKTTVVKGR